MSTFLILGASRGLGDAFACGVPEPGDAAWLVSRSRPASLDRDDGVRRRWIEADLDVADPGAAVAAALDGTPVDVLLYNAGLWEKAGFTDDYDFESSAHSEARTIFNVNLVAAVSCIRSLLPNLRRGSRPKIILTGSTSGLENNDDREVAYVASKFGLRGLAHALRRNLRQEGIAVTVLNPGWIAAEVPWDTGLERTLELTGGGQVPVQDLVAIVRCIVGLSPATCVKEIDIPAMADPNV